MRARDLIDTDESLEYILTHPLESVEKAMVYSSTDALSVLDELEDLFNNKIDWEVRQLALKNCLKYLKGNIQKYPGCDFSNLSTCVANSILDNHPILVQWACMFVCACAQNLQNSYISSIDIIIPPLFQQLMNDSNTIKLSCRCALKEVYTNIVHRRVAKHFLTNSSSRYEIVRVEALDALKFISRNWPPKIISSLKDSIDAAIADKSRALRSSSPKRRPSKIPSPVKRSPTRNTPSPFDESVSPVSILKKGNSDAQKGKTKSVGFAKIIPVELPAEIPEVDLSDESEDNTDDAAMIPSQNIHTNKNLPKPKNPRTHEEGSKLPVRRRMASPTSKVKFSKASPIMQKPQKSSQSPAISHSKPIAVRKEEKPMIAKEEPIYAPPKVLFESKKPINVFENENEEENEEPEIKIPPRSYSPIQTDALEDYMPPTSVEMTEEFLRILSGVIRRGQSDKIAGLEEHLPISITYGSKYISDIEKWKFCLSFLMRSYREEFLIRMPEILSAFYLDLWLIDETLEIFGFDAIIGAYSAAEDQYMNDALIFAMTALTKGTKTSPDSPAAPFLRVLAEEFSGEDAAEIIENALKEPELPPKEIQIDDTEIEDTSGLTPTEVAYRLIKQGKPNAAVDNFVHAIYDCPAEELPQHEKELSSKFEQSVAEGHNKEIDDFVEFLQKASPRLPIISFKDEVEPLVLLACVEGRRVRNIYTGLLASLLREEEVLVRVISLISERADEEDLDSDRVLALAQAVLEWSQAAPAGDLAVSADTVLPVALRLLPSDITRVRRTVVMICVEFAARAEAAFAPYLKKMGRAQQSLVRMYLEKRKGSK